MKMELPYVTLVLMATTFVAIQCESGVRGRVVKAEDNDVLVYLPDSDSVAVGEEFSLWRDRRVESSTEIYRSGVIEITKLLSPDSAEAILIYGRAEVGDKVTKWIISDRE